MAYVPPPGSALHAYVKYLRRYIRKVFTSRNELTSRGVYDRWWLRQQRGGQLRDGEAGCDHTQRCRSSRHGNDGNSGAASHAVRARARHDDAADGIITITMV